MSSSQSAKMSEPRAVTSGRLRRTQRGPNSLSQACPLEKGEGKPPPIDQAWLMAEPTISAVPAPEKHELSSRTMGSSVGPSRSRKTSGQQPPMIAPPVWEQTCRAVPGAGSPGKPACSCVRSWGDERVALQLARHCAVCEKESVDGEPIWDPSWVGGGERAALKHQWRRVRRTGERDGEEKEKGTERTGATRSH